MEKNSNKLIIFGILVVVVLTLSVGFAAYSRTLNISSATAEVTPENTFSPNVKFKTDTLTCSSKSGSGEKISEGELADTDTTWRNVSVSLKAPGDAVTCSVVVANDSAYTAYLKRITFSSVLSCALTTGGAPSTENNTAVCGANGVTAIVSDGNNSAFATGLSVSNSDGIATNNIIAPGGTRTISFDIEYSSEGKPTDQDIVVTIPSVSLLYESSN